MKDLFLKLVKISSPSGHESSMREFLEVYFEQLDIKTTQHMGNLIINLPGASNTVLLVAHVDTVQKIGDEIKPIVKNGQIYSSGNTILGADNKAGVAILLKIAEELFNIKGHPNIYIAFTANEEAGRMTALDLPIKYLKPDLILNVDGGKSPGTVDTEALGQEVFEIEVSGKAAHAATESEKGKNALVAAINILNKFKIGKETNGDTLNIGKMVCDSATNVVPDKVIIKGEVRSFSKLRIKACLSKIKKICKSEIKSGIKVGFEVLKGMGMPVWEKAKDYKWQNLLGKAALRCGLIYKEEKMYACSDANPLATFGVPTYSINRGGKNPHSYDESITVSEMEKTKSYIMEILKSL